MKKIFFLFFVACICGVADAQIYMTRNAAVSFYSSTPLEDIKAVNNQTSAAIDISKKTIAFTCLMKGFQFPKALMQEHFNENYVESDKYPQATFLGSYTGNIDVSKDGNYQVNVTGDLKLHGISKKIVVPVVIEVKGDQLIAKSDFSVKPEDFSIRIPAVVEDKIADQISVRVNAICKKR